MSFKAAAAAVLLSLANVHAKSFNWNQGMSSLWHCQNSYCDPDSYITRTPKGPLEGFKATYHIYNEAHKTQGYVGYSLQESTIYVAIRGSVEIQNFITDATLAYEQVNYPDACRNTKSVDKDLKVHKGFYDCTSIIGADVMLEVTRLTDLYPSFQVVVTGHSLGGAVATLLALMLKNPEWGIQDKVQLYTFGCPRVGNEAFAVCASDILGRNSSRITHSHDIIPHSPSTMRYQHVKNEWYQPTDEVDLQECYGYEDKNCMNQWSGLKLSIDDHLFYLGVQLGSTALDSCAQIM